MSLALLKFIKVGVIIDSDDAEVILESITHMKLLITGTFDHCSVCSRDCRREVAHETILLGS